MTFGNGVFFTLVVIWIIALIYHIGQETRMTWDKQQIDDLAEEALNAAALIIQTKLNVKSGDVGGIFFSDETCKCELIKYINMELMYQDGDDDDTNKHEMD